MSLRNKLLLSLVSTLVQASAVFVPLTFGQATEKSLFQFTGTNGSEPQCTLIFDAQGNLYGTTFAGGPTTALGLVFKLTPTSSGNWHEEILHVFQGGTDGAYPLAGLVMDEQGSLYGTTYQGGVNAACNGGCGTVFRLAPRADGKWT